MYDIKSLYRRALRLTKLLEGQRRRRLCAFRTKDMLSRASHERNDPAKLQTHLLAVDLYLDNVQSQAEHLRQLDPKELLVPVDLYHAPRNSNEAPARKVILDSLPGRRLSEEERKGNVSDALTGRMFQGPEPSWIRKRKINPSQH